MDDKEVLIEYFDKYYEMMKFNEQRAEEYLRVGNQLYSEGAKVAYEHIIDILSDDDLRMVEMKKIEKCEE